MAEIILNEPFNKLWQKAEVFQQVYAIKGDVVRNKEGRKTTRFQQNDHFFYVKLHTGIGWAEVFKNILFLRLPITGARNEWLAIKRLHELDIATLTVCAYGQQGVNPARQQSFIITEALENTLSLAFFCRDWPVRPPTFQLKYALNKKLAYTAKTLKDHGINHRDFYLCHFLLDISQGITMISPDNIDFYLVDLHRAHIRPKTPVRWLVKDIGSLYFSAMDIGLTKRDVLRFMVWYSGKSLAKTLQEDKVFWQRAKTRAIKLYRSEWNREPPSLF